MFEQRFDHICADHARAMEAIEQRIREVVAKRDGELPPSSAPRPAPATGAAVEPAPAEDRGPVAEPAPTGQERVVPAAGATQAADTAPWPERDEEQARCAMFLDPRWNSDLPWE
ncbi:hypothetical protein [Tomitella cavernea]|uniref:Uncharacterized protein n=1 Tax=Tomitella cavernea TaxID=1387982 RepID=A0ABP9CC23_9ACTN|nr:hypothetical protein [Tomitella cavernea]